MKYKNQTNIQLKKKTKIGNKCFFCNVKTFWLMSQQKLCKVSLIARDMEKIQVMDNTAQFL
jgi:hypothetical protein